MKKYEVRFTDNTGCNDSIESYNTEAEAEAAIREELQMVEDSWKSKGYDYSKIGKVTEIWVPGGDQYAIWERLWQ